MSFGLTACTGALYGRNWDAFSDEDIADDRIEELIEAIEDEDEGKIKEMISRNTADDVEGLDVQIQDLIEFYQGEMESYNGFSGPYVSQQSEDGDTRMVFELTYLIYTTEKTYWIVVQDTIMDDFDTSYEGVNYIYIKEAGDWSEGDAVYWGDTETKPGIHIR